MSLIGIVCYNSSKVVAEVKVQTKSSASNENGIKNDLSSRTNSVYANKPVCRRATSNDIY
jgi:hypothetical protein